MTAKHAYHTAQPVLPTAARTTPLSAALSPTIRIAHIVSGANRRLSRSGISKNAPTSVAGEPPDGAAAHRDHQSTVVFPGSDSRPVKSAPFDSISGVV